MEPTDFSTSIVVSQTPQQVFAAVNDPRAWWSQEISGTTDRQGAIFDYHYKDVHVCKIRVAEMIQDRKVIWEVLENRFNFISDKREWVGTKIVFSITQTDGRTQLSFTHHGLTPRYECYQICHDAWTQYIENSLRNLIVTGKGQPNPKEGGFNEYLLKQSSAGKDYSVSFVTGKSAHEAFKAIQSVKSWWTENLEGHSEKQGDEFSVRFGNVHYSRHRLTEVIPDRRIVWLTTENRLNFVADEQEWKGMQLVFDIEPHDGKTKVSFTQIGLNPQVECYEACSTAWSGYLLGSLKSLIETGKGNPEPKI